MVIATIILARFETGKVVGKSMARTIRITISALILVILSSCEEPVQYGKDLIGAWSLQSITVAGETEVFEDVPLFDAWFISINAAAISRCWNNKDALGYSQNTAIVIEFKNDVIVTDDGDIPYQLNGDHLSITIYDEGEEPAELSLLRYSDEFPPLEWVTSSI